MEPLRKLIARVRGHFVQGYAVDLVMGENLLEVQTKTVNGTTRNIYLPYVLHVLTLYATIFSPFLSGTAGLTLPPSSYDKLVIAVGSTSATHGVTGLENCFQLKTIRDAQAIRRRILGG